MEYEKNICPVLNVDGILATGKQFDLDKARSVREFIEELEKQNSLDISENVKHIINCREDGGR